MPALKTKNDFSFSPALVSCVLIGINGNPAIIHSKIFFILMLSPYNLRQEQRQNNDCRQESV